MARFHLDIRNAITVLTDEDGRDCENVLEAIVLAKAALDALARNGTSDAAPWIEVADERGNVIATVRQNELRN